MKNYNHTSSEYFREFIKLVEDYGVWEKPEKMKEYLLTIRHALHDNDIVKYSGGEKKTGRDVVDAMLSGGHFLLLEIDRPSKIVRAEELLDIIHPEVIELCKVEPQEKPKIVPDSMMPKEDPRREGQYEQLISSSAKVKHAWFFVLFQSEIELKPETPEGKTYYLKRLHFHPIRTKWGFDLYSTLDEPGEYIPPTYSLGAKPDKNIYEDAFTASPAEP